MKIVLTMLLGSAISKPCQVFGGGMLLTRDFDTLYFFCLLVLEFTFFPSFLSFVILVTN